MEESSREQSAVLLEGILDTLKQINQRMVAQEQKWDRIAEGFKSLSMVPSQAFDEGTHPTPFQPLHLQEGEESSGFRNEETRLDHHNLEITHSSRLPSSSAFRSGREQKPQIDMIDYRSWRSPLMTSPLHQYSFLTEELGDA